MSLAPNKIRVLTEGNPLKLIMVFAVPLLIGNIFQQLYSLADTLIVGRLIGVEALASVGCTSSITFFILGCVQGMALGFSIVTAQRFGACDEQGVKKSFIATIWLAIITTIVFTAIFTPLVKPCLIFLRTDKTLLDNAEAYLFYVILFGIATNMAFNVLSSVIRALGDSRTPLYFLIVACLINIGLDILFIAVFHTGVAGAAIATVLSQGLSAVLCFIYIRIKFPILRFSVKEFVWDTKDILFHAKIGYPMGFQMSIIAIGSISVTFAVNTLGPTAAAAYTAAMKIENIALSPMMSFGAAMSAYTGQNYGAGKIDRVSEGVRKCLGVNIGVSIFIGIMIILFVEPLVSFFIGTNSESINPADVIALSKQLLTVTGMTYWILAIVYVLRNTIQGLGKSVIPTIAGIGELVMRIIAALALTPVLGFVGVGLAFPMAWLGAAVPLVIAYFAVMKKLKAKQGIKES